MKDDVKERVVNLVRDGSWIIIFNSEDMQFVYIPGNEKDTDGDRNSKTAPLIAASISRFAHIFADATNKDSPSQEISIGMLNNFIENAESLFMAKRITYDIVTGKCGSEELSALLMLAALGKLSDKTND